MIKITDSARNKLIEILHEENAEALRFGLQGGGCNGFSYFFNFAETINDDDLVIQIDDTKQLVVDSMSNQYLENATIDYKKDLMGESFVFHNPDQKSTCGCGSSVSF